MRNQLNSMLHPEILRINRYLISGGVSTAASYLVFLLCTVVTLPMVVSLFLSQLTGIAVGFRVNSRWTFRSNAAFRGLFPRYFAVYFVSFLANLGALILLTGVGHMSKWAAEGLIIPFLAGGTYLALKYWVFASSTTEGGNVFGRIV